MMRHRTIQDGSVLSSVYLSHKRLDPDAIIFLIQDASVIREITLVSPIKWPVWQPLVNPVYFKREKRISCTYGIAKFETGAFYLTCT